MIDTKALKQKTLDLAIMGKLVPQNPDDEPASVLLEKIRAEKEKSGKGKKQPDSFIFRGDDSFHYEKVGGEIKKVDIDFDVPNGWEVARLNALCSISGGKTPSTSEKSFWGNDVVWVTSKDMHEKYIDDSTLKLFLHRLNIAKLGERISLRGEKKRRRNTDGGVFQADLTTHREERRRIIGKV